jgi:formate hydrogenlyase subunit 3/multisubunit Na+/H+ antiporter MnhD subunit
MIYPVIFGIKARTIVFFIMGIFLFLIFTMFAWPRIWMKIYKKERENKYDLKKKSKPKFKTGMLIVLAVVILFMVFFLGTLFGFDRAIKSIPQKPCLELTCAEFNCSEVGITCSTCLCEYCGNYVRLSLPTKGT